MANSACAVLVVLMLAGASMILATPTGSEVVREERGDLYSDLEQLAVKEDAGKASGAANRFLSKELRDAELEDEQFTEKVPASTKAASPVPASSSQDDVALLREHDHKLQRQIGNKMKDFLMKNKEVTIKHQEEVANIRAAAKLNQYVSAQAANVALAKLASAQKKSAKAKTVAEAKAVQDRNAMRTKIDIAAFGGKVGDGTGEIIARQMGDLGNEGRRSVSLNGLPKPMQKTVVAAAPAQTMGVPIATANGMNTVTGVSTKMKTKTSSDKNAAKTLLKQRYANQIKQLKRQLADGNY
jgi:hypothetical protein